MSAKQSNTSIVVMVLSCGASLSCASPDEMPLPSSGPGGAGGSLAGVGGVSGAGPASGGLLGAGGGGGVPTGTGGLPSSTGGGVGTGGVPLPEGSGGIEESGGGGMPGTGGAPSEDGGAAGTGGSPGSCGIRGGMRGKSSRTITVSGAQRTFIAYLPASLDPATPVPFVYVFHGANQTGQGLYDMTEYAQLADTEGIAVVFPDGQGTSSARGTGSLTPWNVTDGPLLCGLGTLVSNPNAIDFAFVDAMKADVLQDQCIDESHVFATGFSMGGYFSHHIACDRPDFRAAAPHSGGTMASLDSCKTGHMPIIIFHGDADVLINEGCDDPNGTLEPGYPASATLWAQKNGCQATYQTIPQTGSNGLNGTCLLYDGCPPDGQVEVCIMQGLGHAWSGAPVCASCIGSGAGWPSATRIEWEFFKTYAW